MLVENHCVLAGQARELLVAWLQRAQTDEKAPTIADIDKFAGALGKVVAIEQDVNGVKTLLDELMAAAKEREDQEAIEEKRTKEIGDTSVIATITVAEGESPENVARRILAAGTDEATPDGDSDSEA